MDPDMFAFQGKKLMDEACVVWKASGELGVVSGRERKREGWRCVKSV